MVAFTREMAEEALQDPNVKKFLDVIKYTEGTHAFSDPYLAGMPGTQGSTDGASGRSARLMGLQGCHQPMERTSSCYQPG